MEDILSLIKLLDDQKLKHIKTLNDPSALSNKTRQLYDGLRNGDFRTDHEASYSIYTKDEAHPAYLKLKHRFKERLINTLFFIDIQQYGNSAYQKTLNRSYKNWAASKILLDKGPRKTAISIQETILKNVLKYDIEELAIMIIKDLKMHYGLYEYNLNKFNRYKKLGFRLKHIINLKNEIEEYFCFLGHLIESKKSIQFNDEIKNIEEKVTAISDKSQQIDSYYLRYHIFTCFYIIYLIKKDFNSQIKITQEAINYFHSKKGFKKYGTATFLQIRGIADMSLGNYNNALLSFNKCLDFNPKPGGLLWQSLRNYIFLIDILRKNYDSAYVILSNVINHGSFNKSYVDFKQHWFLKEAFIQFLIRIGKIQPDNIKVQKLRAFRINRFINETPTLTKDKRGYNVSIHIIQMLFLIID